MNDIYHSTEVKKHLDAVIEYLFTPEFEDWQERGNPEAHIYKDIQYVAAFLEQEKAKPIICFENTKNL